MRERYRPRRGSPSSVLGRVVVLGTLAATMMLAGCRGGETAKEPEEELRVMVGDCFGADEIKPVPCNGQHTAQTILVSDEPPRRGAAALRPCRTAQAGFLGQDFNSRLDVRLWVSTEGSWFRCDLVLRNSTRSGLGYGALTGTLKGAFRRSVPVGLQACLEAPYDPLLDQKYVACSQPHRSRELTVAPAIGTLDEPFPGDLAERAISACNATAAGGNLLSETRSVEAYYPENVQAWESGERTADCWVTADRGLLPALRPRN